MSKVKFDCEIVPSVRPTESGAGRFEPVHFETNQGRTGWMVRISGRRRLATPAVADGRVLLGGGFGSYEFYAFDAESGELAWRIRTKDDGPTAAVVYEGLVAFNTESCTLLVCEVATGKERWHRWLGDPLMSQPAVVLVHGEPLVVMVYPARHGQHQMAAFSLSTGQPRWHTEIAMDVISAPVAVGDTIYAALMNGDIVEVDASSGEVRSVDREARATSAPWVDDGELFYSKRADVRSRATRRRRAQQAVAAAVAKAYKEEEVAEEVFECVEARRWASKGFVREDMYRRVAQYLSARPRSKTAASWARRLAMDDAHVGHAFAPVTAKLDRARLHLGYRAATVGGAWGYQGSRPVVAHGRIYTAIGGVVRAQSRATRETAWELELFDTSVDYQTLTPVAVAGNCVYTATIDGTVLAIDAARGTVKWAVQLPQVSIEFQPAIHNGRVYIGTSDGCLWCLDAQDATAHGWPMWGGGPGHNGPLLDRSDTRSTRIEPNPFVHWGQPVAPRQGREPVFETVPQQPSADQRAKPIARRPARLSLTSGVCTFR